MSRFLALEWSGNEARAAIASRHGDRAVIEQAFAISLQPAASEDGPAEPDLCQSIAEALEARNIGQLDALVAVGRGGVELRQLQLPFAPDAELPGMVRLRAMLEFNELDEKWLLDFVPIDDESQSNRNVLAAAIAPAVIDRIQAIGQRGNLKIQRVLLRSCAAAALLARAGIAQPGQVQLLVELFSNQADLTAVVDGKVLLPRMVRLSADVSDPAGLQGLLSEIRLTTAAVQNQFSGRQVAGIVLCGRGNSDAVLARQIEEATGTHTVLLDPFAGLDLGPPLSESPPEQPGRFAAVLGMLLTECAQARHAIDFLHPRQAVVPANPRKKWTLAAVAAALLLLSYFVYGRLAYWQLESDYQQLQKRSSDADNILRAAGSRNLAAAKDIAKWADGEVVWLDRLRDLSEDFPAADAAMVDHLSLTRQSDRTAVARSPVRASTGPEMQGKMDIEGLARDNKSVGTMEQALRAHGRRLEGSKTNEDRSSPPYSVKFWTTVLVGEGAKP
jgi:Tfp pilus assembly PilM family ATPase